MKAEKMYKEVFNLLNKYEDIHNFNIERLRSDANNHLFGIELNEKYGLHIDARNINSLDWNTFGHYMSISRYGRKYNRIISCSDDGKQPEDELLLNISFPTGAYIFGQDYPTEFFEKFFTELKNFNPKYIDSANHDLYFSMDNAKDVFNDFDTIFNRFRELNREDVKLRKIAEMKEAIKKLESC